MEHASSLRRAERILGVPLRFDAVLSYDAPNRPVTLRARTDEKPRSVIVKRAPAGAHYLFHEWTSLEFLAAIPEAAPLVPRVYGGDADALLLVMEDLGRAEERRLGELLHGDDAAVAESALLAMQRTLGRLHAATAGRHEEYRALRGRFPGADATTRHRVHQIADALPELPERLGPRPGLADEIETALEHLRSRNPFQALGHGDFTPANAFLTDDGGVRLFDLETGGFRHAFLDGAFARIRYLHSVWARRIPEALQRRMLDAYRGAYPAAADDERFWPAYVAGCLGWLAGLCRFYPDVVEEDVRWGGVTNRQRIVTGLEHFAALAAESGCFPAAGEAARDFAAHLRGAWPEEDCTMRVYPALAGEDG